MYVNRRFSQGKKAGAESNLRHNEVQSLHFTGQKSASQRLGGSGSPCECRNSALASQLQRFFYITLKVKVKVAQSCLTLCDYTAHGIL